jgi:peptidoglycan/LPS O-acetylase OafA/YrhL
LVVAGAHSLGMLTFSPSDLWRRRALGNIFYGAGAVLVFFILSGFVLGLTIERHSKYDWTECWAFIKRRALRLYPTFFFFGCLYYAYNKFFLIPPDFRTAKDMTWFEFIQNLLLLKISLNGVAWSLRPEFLFSLLLPLTYLWTFRRPVISWVIFGGLLLLYYALPPRLFHLDYIDAPYYLLYTLYGGTLIAFFRENIRDIYRQVPKFGLGAMTIVALGVCATSAHFGNHFDWFAYAAAFLISIIALDVLPTWFRFLDAKALISLGNISYSFYLLHPLCLMIIFTLVLKRFSPAVVLGHPWIATLFLLSASTALTIPLASLTYDWIESRFTSTRRRTGTGSLAPSASGPGKEAGNLLG